jgi:hypothetical protein
VGYGLELLNEAGRTLIDDQNRQVQILKTNTIYPRSIGASSANGNTRRESSSKPSPVIVPGNLDRGVIFMHPKKTSSGTEATTITAGVQEGTCTITWDPAFSGAAAGTDVIYASFTKSSATVSDGSYPTMDYTTTTVHDDPLVDCLGDSVSGWTGFNGQTIKKIETTSYSGLYKLTFTGNSTASIGTNDLGTVEKQVVWFYGPNHEGFAWGTTSALSNYRIEYKMGTITEDAEETGQYGLEVFKSDGTLAYSSNRESVQLKDYSASHTGEADLKPSSTVGEWETGSSGRAVTLKKEVADFDHAWVMVTSTGKSAAFVGDFSGSPYSYVAGTAYVWSNIGYTFLDNKSRAGFASDGIVSTLSSNTNTVGVSLTPVEMNYLNSAPQITGGRSATYVHDTWCAEGIRTLITGKFL